MQGGLQLHAHPAPTQPHISHTATCYDTQHHMQNTQHPDIHSVGVYSRVVLRACTSHLHTPRNTHNHHHHQCTYTKKSDTTRNHERRLFTYPCPPTTNPTTTHYAQHPLPTHALQHVCRHPHSFQRCKCCITHLYQFHTTQLA